MSIKFDMKFAAMILILTEKIELTRTALNKLLFFCDLIFFMKHNRKITNQDYIKLQFGPVPEDIDTARSWLINNGFLVEERIETKTNYQFNYKTQVENVNLNGVKGEFSKEELNAIILVRDNLSEMSANQLSERTHKYEPWKSANWFAKLDFVKANSDEDLKDWLKEMNLLD